MSIIIQSVPSGSINIGDTVYFSIITGTSNCFFATYEWYVQSGVTEYLIGTGIETSYTFNEVGSYLIYLKVYEYCETFWHGGQFYGGVFRGDFGGGTFNYGDLNGCAYADSYKKPKPFIVNITGSGKK